MAKRVRNSKEVSIENASSFLNITKDDFDKAINELKFETGN